MNALQRDLKRLVPWRKSWALTPSPPTATDSTTTSSPGRFWLNDPNGLCCYNGVLPRILSRYSPFDASGGVKALGSCPQHRPDPLGAAAGHAVSGPASDCHGAYSGSALVENGALYLYYTGNVKHPGPYDYITAGRGHNLCLAVSRDRVTLDSKQCLMYNRDYPSGLSCHVRDPKVFAWQGGIIWSWGPAP